MLLDEKIKELESRRYNVEGPSSTESVSPLEFRLNIYHFSGTIESYKLVRVKDDILIPISFRRLSEQIFEATDGVHTYVDPKYEQVLKSHLIEDIGEYLPTELISDIVDLYLLREERKRHPLRQEP